jgi:hypothetical protein
MANGAMRVLEQGNLLGGADLVPVEREGRRKKRSRPLHVGAKSRLGFAAALALVVTRGREKAKERGETWLSRCPRCGHIGPTEQDFGIRLMKGGPRPQSWCRTCRGVNLPPLKALGSASNRERKAAQPKAAPSKASQPKAARHKARAKPEERAPREEASSAPRSGWLFPPETLSGK